RLAIKPLPMTIDERLDYFGNHVSYFAIHEAHYKLSVVATSKVDLQPPKLPTPAETPAWEDVRTALGDSRNADHLAASQFAFASPFIRMYDDLRDYALASFTRRRPLWEAALDLTARIHKDFKYQAHSTTISTPLHEVFRNRRGVCQDFAHLQIGCLRSLGLAAQYVSGYLLTDPPPGQPKLVGADASHAWLSVYCPGSGWLDIDPTNNEPPSTRHVTLAWGRDYGDLTPVRGVFVGGGDHAMNVSVDVSVIDG
ncbi:MAG TPA: transglutaminase family protein, partial [Pirellulales bacterium]|nr:transglutaminase family protein [Pirellulales bacterium]